MRDPKLEDFWRTWRRYARIIALWGLATVLVGVTSGSVAFAMGGLCGGIVAWLNFMQLAKDITRAVEMEPAKAQRFAAARYTLRYIATGAVLTVIVTQERLGLTALIAALFPLFSIKLTLYAETGYRAVRQWLGREKM